MTLLQQFQSFIGSIFFGFLISFLWSLFNRLFYKFQGKWVRLPIEALFFLACGYVYFLFLVSINQAILNIHYLLGLALGVLIYFPLYAKFINPVQERFYTLINRKLTLPLKRRYAIIKKKQLESRKKRHEKRKQKKMDNQPH